MAAKSKIIQLTKYEISRLIGARALQIAMGAPLLVTLNEEKLEAINYNPIEIAKMEYERDLLPLTVVRPSPANK